MAHLIDSFGRTINYLRLSVTDRCNFRCRYCMPAAGVKHLSHDEVLRYEELHNLARQSVALGVEKIRITGGEPLIRKGITGFLADLAHIPGLRKLVLTTNGFRLAELATELKAAGVESVNISIDSLHHDVFAHITRGGDLKRVLAGLAAAETAGFSHVKINVVIMRGINDSEVLDFARLAIDRPYRIRFIEYMPTIGEAGWRNLLVPGQEILSRIADRYRMNAVLPDQLAGPSVNYRIDGAAGTIGIITPVSSHFCSDCNRIRVTSTGIAKSCLFDETGTDLKPYLRNGNMGGLAAALRKVVGGKPDRHLLYPEQYGHTSFSMAGIGG